MIIVHDGRAHEDDFLATCVLIYKTNQRALRTKFTSEHLENSEYWVVDQGLSFNQQLHNFDHHHIKEEICGFTMVLDYFYGKTYREDFPQLRFVEIYDSYGSKSAAKFAKVSEESLSIIHSPIRNSIISVFSKINGEINDPMYTSGLVFATAANKEQQEEEDGYLTAYEASNLTLNNTFLVVLSACETGQGTYEDSEGVWGLQRAFQVAGVRYLVMSLFKVDDQITALLMSEFYTHLFNGDDVLQAFKKAQNKVRKTSDNPLHWGAFVIKGI